MKFPSLAFLFLLCSALSGAMANPVGETGQLPEDSGNLSLQPVRSLDVPEGAVRAGRAVAGNNGFTLFWSSAESIVAVPDDGNPSFVVEGFSDLGPDPVFLQGEEVWGAIARDGSSGLVLGGNGDDLDVVELPPVNGEVVTGAVGGGGIHLIVKPLEGRFLLHLDRKIDAPADVAWSSESTGIENLENAALGVNLDTLLIVGDSADGNVAFRRLAGDSWKPAARPPRSLGGYAVLPVGDSYFLLFPLGTGERRPIPAYASLIDRWTFLEEEGASPKGLLGAAPLGGLDFALISSEGVIEGEVERRPTRYGIYDHLVVAAFMVTMLIIGWFFSRRGASNADYFRGGRRVPFWASGLSLFATGASAISLMAMPGMSFSRNWLYFSLSIYIAFSTILVLLVYVPLARRLDVSTANEYLERRFGLSLRLFGAVIYSLSQIMARLAAIMLLPAIAISAIMGIPMTVSIVIMGVVTTIYATMGGIEGVIWTDVIQAIVMLAAVILCAGWALALIDISFSEAWSLLQSEEKLTVFNPSLGLLEPTMLVLFANSLVACLAQIGDQNFIQRVQCTPTEKEAKKAVLTQIIVAVPLNVILFSLGTVLYLFYREHPDLLDPTLKADGVFPLFAAQVLPAGLAGLVVAAIFAATMSTLSSAINSTANLGVEDFYRRLRRTPPSDKSCLLLGRILTFVLGIVGTSAALWLATSELRSVWDLAILIMGIILGPITGFFLLGVFTERTHSAGAFAGGIASVAATLYCRENTELHHFLYLPIGVFSCVIVGYLASWILPGGRKDLDGLTVYTLYRRQ